MQVIAYRELLLRNRINEAAKANMLAYASGSDLDNLAAFYGVERLADEEDDRLKIRTQLALEGFSTAGPVGAYIFHALSASNKVKSVSVKSPNPGVILVTILSNLGVRFVPSTTKYYELM
ncbi:MAG: phage-related baseplate assembly protein [Rickettsiales bacterium]